MNFLLITWLRQPNLMINTHKTILRKMLKMTFITVQGHLCSVNSSTDKKNWPNVCQYTAPCLADALAIVPIRHWLLLFAGNIHSHSSSSLLVKERRKRLYTFYKLFNRLRFLKIYLVWCCRLEIKVEGIKIWVVR